MLNGVERKDEQAGFEKVVLVTRKTRLAELVERFNTHAQAKFYIEHAGGDFREYEVEDEAYRQGDRDCAAVGGSRAEGYRWWIEAWCHTFTFLPQDIVVDAGAGWSGGEHGEVCGITANCGGEP